MKPEEHDDLWELLGRAKTTSASPFFSRNVLRAIRETQPERLGVWSRVSVFWKFATVVAAVVAIAVGVLLQRPQPADPLVLLARQVSASPDYQVISHLDELLDSEQNSVWLEASAY